MMTKESAKASFLKFAQMRGAEKATAEIAAYALAYAGFNEWVSEKECRQYINFGNDSVYVVTTRSRERGLEIASWNYDSKSAKVRKANADIVERAKAAFESAKAELISLISA